MDGWRLIGRRGVTVTQVFLSIESRVQVFFQTRPNVIHFLFFASMEHRGYSASSMGGLLSAFLPCRPSRFSSIKRLISWTSSSSLSGSCSVDASSQRLFQSSSFTCGNIAAYFLESFRMLFCAITIILRSSAARTLLILSFWR